LQRYRRPVRKRWLRTRLQSGQKVNFVNAT
jgi:hypothetical protein